MVTLSVTCIGCSKIEDDYNEDLQLKSTAPPMPNADYTKTWTENFQNQFALNANWVLFGTPQPQWVAAAYGKSGLFNNHGPSPEKSYGVSVLPVGTGKGYTVEGEVMLKIRNPEGTCVCPGIAVSQDQNPVINKSNEIPTGLSMKLVYAGSEAIWFPAHVRMHTSFVMEFISENENVVSSGYIPADVYSNSWHKLKIVVTSTRYVKFYCDNELIWAPFNRIHPMMMSDKKVVLGYTSDGNSKNYAGRAYHDWVKVTYTVPPETE